LIKSIFLLISVIFTELISYKFLYASYSFHRINRILLLLGAPIALSIALVAPKFDLPWANTQSFSFQLPEILIEGKNLNEQLIVANDSLLIWQPLYYLGIIASALYFLSGVYYISKLAQQAERHEVLKHKVLTSDKIKNPFCLGRWVFIPSQLLESKDLELIVQHELYHSSLRHHYDRFYFKIISTLLWFDPAVHLMAKELRQVHEFEVDALIVKAESIENYAHMLLSSTLGGDLAYPEKAIAPSPFFNSSLIKTRITMLYQKESPQWKKSIYLAVLPLLATMTLIACNKASDESPSNSTHIESRESSLSLDQIDRFPVASGTSMTASAEELKATAISSISSHISYNFKYPVLAQELGMEGKIHVQFVIDKNGEITDIEVLKSIEATNTEEKEAVLQAEQEATALIASIPAFTKPAQKDGKAVSLKMVLPISLKLS